MSCEHSAVYLVSAEIRSRAANVEVKKERLRCAYDVSVRKLSGA